MTGTTWRPHTGWKAGQTWPNRHRAKKPRDTIKWTRDPEEGTTNDWVPRINPILRTRILEPDSGDLEGILHPLRSKLGEDAEEEQAGEAIRKTKGEKAPGRDGVRVELWKSIGGQFLSERDEIRGLLRILERWCAVLGAKLNTRGD